MDMLTNKNPKIDMLLALKYRPKTCHGEESIAFLQLKEGILA